MVLSNLKKKLIPQIQLKPMLVQVIMSGGIEQK